MEQSKAKVQLTQKPDSPNMQQLLERVITVCGEREQLYTASNMILTRIRDDPQSASCPNLSYQNVTGLVANANPTGSPYAPVNEATLLTAASGLGLAVGSQTLAATNLAATSLQPMAINHQLANMAQVAAAAQQQQQPQQQNPNQQQMGHQMGALQPQHTPPPQQQPQQQNTQGPNQQAVQTAAAVVANGSGLTNQQIGAILANQQNQHMTHAQLGAPPPQNQNTGYEVYGHYQVPTSNPNLINRQFLN